MVGQLSIPLRAVLYKEDGIWIAHCLEFDLLGDGNTPQDALKSLNDAIMIQIETCLRHNNPANLFKPAEARYFRMFAQGKNVVIGQLKLIRIDSVTIEGIEAREYSGSECQDADLAMA